MKAVRPFSSCRSGTLLPDMEISGYPPRRTGATGIHLATALILGFFLCQGATRANPTFDADLEALTKTPHRLVGSDENAAATAYLADALRAAGVTNLVIQPFTFARPVIKTCRMETSAAGKTWELTPLRGNGLLQPTTPSEGITGPLVHAGLGRPEDFLTAGLTVQGAIVVLDYNCGDGWYRAFRLGARAVVLLRGAAPCSSHSSLHLSAEANLPRFYYVGSRADLPAGSTVTIHSDIRWTRSTACNVIGFIPGTAPTYSLDVEEAILFSAPIDSFGEAPTFVQGARFAANAATLLEQAREFVRAPPARHTFITFFNGDGQGQLGASAFYRALEAEGHQKDAWVETRATFHSNQFALVTGQVASLQSVQFATSLGTLERPLVDRLKRAADDRVARINQDLFRLRRDPSQSELVSLLEADKIHWNELRRALGSRRNLAALAPGVLACLDLARQEVLASLTRRLTEMEADAKSLAADRDIQTLLTGRKLVLHIDWMLGDASDRWTLMPGGWSGLRSPKDVPNAYTHLYRAATRAIETLQPPHVEAAAVDGSLTAPWGLLGEGQQLHRAGHLASPFGIYNAAIVSCYDPLLRDGTPDDTVDRLDRARFLVSAAEARSFLAALVSSPDLSVPSGIAVSRQYAVPVFENGQVKGPRTMGAPHGGAFADTPIADAVLQFRPSRWGTLSYYPFKTPAFDDSQFLMTSQDGTYFLGPLVGEHEIIQSYRTRVLQFDSNNAVIASLDQASTKEFRKRLTLFNATSGCLPLPPQRGIWRAYDDPSVNLMSSLANASLDDTHSAHELADGVISWASDKNEPSLKLFALPHVALLNNGPPLAQSATNEKQSVEGLGFPADIQPGGLAVTRQSAADLLRLNASRLDLLSSRNVADQSLSRLHQQAMAYLKNADDDPTPLRQEALAAASFWLSQEVYQALRQTLDDLVNAVMILLGLAIPFAFLLERVVIGAPTIHRQITFFAILFGLTFLALYVSHPAFAIANTPVIIFLGFTILILSASVVVIIMRRFESELKQLQGLTNTVHAADVSRVGTFLAAMQMGISTMRRRPMRTALTAITVLLLTFTILCFASFRRELGPVRLFVGPNPDYHGALVHDVSWGVIPQDTVDVLTGLAARQVADGNSPPILCRRTWLTTYSVGDAGFLLYHPASNTHAAARAILGIDDSELAERTDLRAVFGESLDGKILMTSAVARRLGVEPGLSVTLRGHSFIVGPILQARDLAMLEDMGRNPVLPVDFSQPRNEKPVTDEGAEASLANQLDWTPLPPDSVIVMSADTVLYLGGLTYEMSCYTKDAQQAGELSDELAAILNKPVYGTRADGVFVHILGTVLAASGAKDLFFPILLGGLVVFGTMLGSVSDREREIYTFSALGLAPRHVATLFLSESLVYALLGGMGGYLLAQATMATLVRLAAAYHFAIPEMNVSSTHTIVTILIIMATVLLSALYPAVRASRSANPGLMRAWKAPAAEGDTLTLVFPFTVSQYHATGILAFLREHFHNHGDVGLGHFLATGTELTSTIRTSPDVRRLSAAADSRVTEARAHALLLTATVSLAPFDLGVSQDFSLETRPSDIEGIDEIHVTLRRRSGQPRDWQRLNKPFLDEIRKQFLIWRSLAPETMEHYRNITLHGGPAA